MYVHIIYRIGLSGDPAPRHVIPSTVSMKPYGEVRKREGERERESKRD